jgi:hypothetical protein
VTAASDACRGLNLRVMPDQPSLDGPVFRLRYVLYERILRHTLFVFTFAVYQITFRPVYSRKLLSEVTMGMSSASAWAMM